MKRLILLLCLLLVPAAAAARDKPVDAQDPRAPPSVPDPQVPPSVPDPQVPPSAPAPLAPPASTPAPAAQQDTPPWMAPLRDADRDRIRRLAASREKALNAAATGKPNDVKLMRDLLAAAAQPLDPSKLIGNWRCRSFELGGMFPLTVNPFFACRIRRDGNAFWLDKTSGSVLRHARLDPIDSTRMLMFGAYYAAGDKQPPYGTDDYRDEVGILEQIGPKRLRVELPEPRASETAWHEIIELVQ